MKGKHKKWTEIELNELAQLYKLDTAITELAKIFKVERHNITVQLKRLNVYQDDRTRWTEENINKLKQLAPNRNIREIATILHKSYTSINSACCKFGIKTKNSYDDWSKEELQHIAELKKLKLSNQEIADQTRGRTKDSVRMKLSELKLTKPHSIIWTEEMLSQFRTMILNNIKYIEISKVMNISTSAISGKAHELGILNNNSERLSSQRQLRKSGQKKCFCCNKIKSIEDFVENKSSGKTYQRVACMECYPVYCLEVMKKQKLTTRIRQKLRRAKIDIIKRNLPFEIDERFAMELLEKQGWKCFYSGITMNYKHGDLLSFTFDRKNSSLGYTKENVVAACHFVNKAKMELPIDRFIDMCRKITENTKDW